MKKIKDMSEHEINEYMKAIELINNIYNNFAIADEICLFANAEINGNYQITVDYLWKNGCEIGTFGTMDNPDLTFEDICRACNLKTSLF